MSEFPPRLFGLCLCFDMRKKGKRGGGGCGEGVYGRSHEEKEELVVVVEEVERAALLLLSGCF